MTWAPGARSFRATLAAVLAPLGAACVLSSPRVESSGAIPCSTNQECPAGNVCFLGECRGNSSQLGTVYAEVRPPSNTPYAPAQRAGLDLRQSVIIDFAVGGTPVSGRVLQAQDPDGGVVPPPVPIANAQVTFIANDTTIPGRTPRVQALSGSTGDFSALLPSADAGGSWDVEVQAPPLPPSRLAKQTFPPAGPPLDIQLPAPSQLVRESGVTTQGGAPIAFASIIAVDADGGTLSAGTTADASGAFALSLPPNPFPYYLRVSGPGASDGGVAPLIPAFDPAGPFNGPPDAGFAALPPQSQLTGRVVDSTQNGVASARVYALSLSGVGWVLSTSAVTASDGSFTLGLLSGRYALEAAPGTGPSDPALGAPPADPDVPIGASSLPPIVCGPKVSGLGVVLRPDGSPAGAGTQITATRLPDRLISSRTAQVSPTDGNGRYVITGDPGQYRVEFAPPFSPPNTLPRKLVTFTLLAQPAQQNLPSVQLGSPLEVVGTVRSSANGSPVSLATVDFFALDSASHAVVIGTGVTDSQGHYTVVLPDVLNPAAGSP